MGGATSAAATAAPVDSTAMDARRIHSWSVAKSGTGAATSDVAMAASSE